MKDKIVYLLLGIFVTISVAFTSDTAQWNIEQPANPISTIVGYGMYSKEVANYIVENAKKGYQVQHIEATGSINGIYVVIMVKY